MTAVPNLRMNDGREIPQLGYGVFQIDPAETADMVTLALEAGYRLIDTAAAYQNEQGVGTALAKTDVAREDLFITTKLWNRHQGYDETLRAFDDSVTNLGLETLDLYLIHWPQPMFDQYVDSWRAFEKLQADGRITSIGVSNFTQKHLQRLFDETNIVPAVNQIELHPWLSQPELRAFHAEHGILTESWGPIGQGKGVLDEPVLGKIADAKGRSKAQVVLRWHLQLGSVVIPKSVTPERIVENIDVFDFELTDDEVAAISALDKGKRLGPDPEVMDNR